MDELYEEENSNIYLLIDGNDNNRPQVRYIHSKCNFDSNINWFVLSNMRTSIEDAFNDTDEVYFRCLRYKKLDIYKDDLPKKV